MRPSNKFKRHHAATLSLCCFILACVSFSFVNGPNSLLAILEKLKNYHQQRSQEKLYLHFDKPFYTAGDNVWFKGYLMEASLHGLDSQSRVVYVELIDNTKNVIERKAYYVENGVVPGDFQLSDSLQPGKYLIRGYTNYMKNIGEEFFFKKELSIVSAMSKPSDADVFHRDSIDLQFFPEGGNLVACGANNRVAFKALSPDGKSIAVEGEISDEENQVVAVFQTQHDGMGTFLLNPVAGKKYVARVTKPYTINRSYPLPQVKENGYTVFVTETPKSYKIVVFANTTKSTTEPYPISIVVQSRGIVYHAQKGAIVKNSYFTFLPRPNFPDGISQITIFDADGLPVAERLVYRSRKESLNVNLKTSANQYGKRSMVNVEVEATHADGAPAQGNFSMSVYDASLVKSVEEYPLTIVNYLSLTLI